MKILKTAFKFIKYDRAKSIGVVVGILISTFLIGQQLGILDYLKGLMAATVDNANTQIWVVDTRTKDINQLTAIDIKKLREVQSVAGVKEAFPIVITTGSATLNSGRTSAVTLIGIQSPTYYGGPKASKIIKGSVEDLQVEGAVSADFFDSKVFSVPTDVGTQLEINGKKAHIALQTKGIRGFGFAFMYTTIERARYFANISPDKINAIMVNILPEQNIDDVVAAIDKQVYGIKAFKSADIRDSTIATVIATTGIAQSTGTLIIFALISGLFIIGLTMYSSALDRIKDYGTLKAIGASNGYIRKLILSQSVVFAVVGYVLAYGMLQGFRTGVAETGLLVNFSAEVLIILFVTILIISLIGSAFALRKIKTVEPASVFRG